ncbi:hypothetical protein HYU13_00980 [Candidatus Woesearchaeota archaeon]|nr:hypothetical protein [Candidatus Woesearchaeota archaeon]
MELDAAVSGFRFNGPHLKHFLDALLMVVINPYPFPGYDLRWREIEFDVSLKFPRDKAMPPENIVAGNIGDSAVAYFREACGMKVAPNRDEDREDKHAHAYPAARIYDFYYDLRKEYPVSESRMIANLAVEVTPSKEGPAGIYHVKATFRSPRTQEVSDVFSQFIWTRLPEDLKAGHPAQHRHAQSYQRD